MKRYEKKMSDLRVLATKTKMLGIAGTTGIVAALVASSVVRATDLQIYAAPTAGKKTIVMMLDTSASMNYTSADYGVCTNSTSDSGTVITSFNASQSDNNYYKISSGTTPSYNRRYCYVKKTRIAEIPAAVLNIDTGCEKVNDTTYRCYDRITRLKDGLFTLLDSNEPTLKAVRIGVGHYSTATRLNDSESIKGRILYPAAELGEVDSSQRVGLKTAIARLVAQGYTPTAAGYAEAAAYLMGTKTYRKEQILKDFYKTVGYKKCSTASYPYYYDNKCYQSFTPGYSGTVRNSSATGYTYNVNDNKWYQYFNRYHGNTQNKASSTTLSDATLYYQCNSHESTDWGNRIQYCKARLTSANWSIRTNNFPNLSSYVAEVIDSSTVIYKQDDLQKDGEFSGFDESEASTKNMVHGTYISPLPPVENRQSCDGQGVYILSDGEPTNKDDGALEVAMSSALETTNFSCSGGLTGGNDWHCKSNFAGKLYDKNNNPTGVSIQTAFVGFSKSFSNLSSTDVLNACKLSSRAQLDRSSDDKCSPNQVTNAVRAGGYGNGGFFISNTSKDITNSVIQFINNLGVAPLDPLSTGAISVPVDALNPSGFQPFGYLRALEPNPAIPVKVWIGNLKKYSIENGALKANSETVFDQSGIFNQNTKDIWNTTINNDGGLVRHGGVYSQLPMPTSANPTRIRNLLTDVALDGSNNPIRMTDFSKPLLVLPKPADNESIINTFSSQEVLKNFSNSLKLKVLNYLGYDLDLTDNETLPTALTAPNNPFVSMGGSIHSFPVQLTYSGNLDDSGNLTDVREQSVLYGSMEGALRIVNAETGEEQMSFIPAEILLDAEKSRALRLGEGGDISHGVSGAWIADPTYKTVRSSKPNEPSVIEAKSMNVYGGLRMGGESYYGLNVLKPKEPEILFRVGSDIAGFERMGQTWSKPVLVNVRHNGKIKRAMVVGGGYDMCYENPRFKLNTANPEEFQIKNSAGVVIDTCQKSEAKGNAVYIIDALTGEKLWSASSVAKVANDASHYNQNLNMKHSIVSRISTLDRDADGLVDHLYFGDLGGQVFRADLDNKQTVTKVDNKDVYSPFGVRVTRMANLGQSLKSDDSGELASGDKGDSPRFYQAPTVTIHDQGSNTFIAVTIASGDRSTPLDVTPTQGRETMLPSAALINRPLNNVYSIFDHDFIKKALITGTVNLVSENLVLADLQKDPQLLADGTYISTYFTNNGIGKYGWYRSLSSQPDGTELADKSIGGVTRVAGGVKAFEEEPIAISNNFFVPIYDPQGNSIAAGDPCKPRIVGESNRQQYCLPYGVCLTSAGYKNNAKEDKTGFQLEEGKNTNVLGAGIRGITLGPTDSSQTGSGKNSCGSLTLLGNIEGAGQWDCQRIFNPTKWYEKYVTAK